MVKTIESNPIIPCPLWIVDARRQVDVVRQGARRFHWRKRGSPNKPVLRAAVAAALIAGAARNVSAAFDLPAISAQSAAMGGSSLAGQGDSAAMFQNAAGVAGLQNPEGYFMYNQLYTGLNGVGSIGQGLITLGIPTKIGSLGVGLSDFQASGLLNERVIGLTFARRWFGAVDAGITAKYLYHNYLIGSDPSAAANPVFSNGTSRGAFALDAGAIVPIADDLKLGLAVRNINQPDVGLASQDLVAREVEAGLAYNIKPWAARATADYTYRTMQSGTLQQRSEPGVGLEKYLADGRVKFRVGLTPDQFSAGIGLQLGALGLDYTFLLSRTLYANNAGTHMVGLRYRFGEIAQSSARSDK